ncbi:MAG: amidase family protein [Gammaproteobacteria bacterium]|nr:amidase family protein [Gammaproteobacteria bacterium]
MAVEGPMARSVADLRVAYELLSGWHPRDPFSVPAALTAPPIDKRAGLVTKMPHSIMPPATIEAIKQAGRVLEEAGWQVDEVEPPELAHVRDILGLPIGRRLAANARDAGADHEPVSHRAD